MFRSLARKILPNPLDKILRKAQRKNHKTFLLAWNRGLGDIALGLYAIVHRIKTFIPDAKIVFLIRENLKEGFELFEGVSSLTAPSWKRGEEIDVKKTLLELGYSPSSFDVIIEKPDPTYWVSWQRGTLTPRLKWNPSHDALYRKFQLDEKYTYIAVQMQAETSYGLWRNWPLSHWMELFKRLKKREDIRILLFGFGSEPKVEGDHIIDLRGKTSLFEMISLIKNLCSYLMVPDSGILSMIYYLNASFPIRVLSFWGDPRHGVLKQNVSSPNPLLIHEPLIGSYKDLSTVTVEDVLGKIKAPLSFKKREVPLFAPIQPESYQEEDRERGSEWIRKKKAAAVILAAGQGSRLGFSGPKGCFPIAGGKSLFQIFAEKVKALGEDLDLAIMCSPSNRKQTEEFFSAHGFFGLHPHHVHFFSQTELPFSGLQGEWILDQEGKRAKGPDGNGAFYESFTASLFEKFKQQGIEHLCIIPVDNPLAHPFLPELLGVHVRKGNELSGVGVERREASEKVGIWVTHQGKLHIREYFEGTVEEKRAFANVNLFCLSMKFVERMAKEKLSYVQVEKEWGGKKVLKWERFLFDAFSHAKKASVISFSREICYAPLKTKQSIQEVTLAVARMKI